jgi:hypothetical protein
VAATAQQVTRKQAQPGLQPAGVGQAPRRYTKSPSWWRQFYKDWGATFGMLLAAAAIAVGYFGRNSRRLFADEGLGYFLGIVGTFLILMLLLYPLRKRFRLLKNIGPVRNWFRVHMMLGGVGPLSVLYHSNFMMGSVNSTAALVSMLLVSGSGLVGRFLYSKIHHGLYGRRTNLKELLASVKLSTKEAGGAAQFVPHLMTQVAEFDRQVLKPPQSVLESIVLPVKLIFKTRTGYRRITAFVSEQLDEQSVVSPAVAKHRDRLEAAVRRFVKEHLRRVRKVAAFAAYERLFSLWHDIHRPFFYLLLITAIVHVVAVHTYSI